jgi:hypothetical protein
MLFSATAVSSNAWKSSRCDKPSEDGVSPRLYPLINFDLVQL